MASSDRPAAPVAGFLQLNRRQLLRLLTVSAGASLLRWPRIPLAAGAASSLATPGFLDADELALLDAATAVLIPTDGTVGAHECGVIDYIQNLLSLPLEGDANCDTRLTAADLTAVARQQGPRAGAECPGADVNGDGVVDGQDADRVAVVLFAPMVARRARVFAGGPFSGRQPQPHFPTGSLACQACHAPVQPGAAVSRMAAAATVDNYPPNFFEETIPLTRLQALSWTIRILGARAVPGAEANPFATDSLEVDLRRKYREGLAALAALSRQEFGGQSFVQLTATAQRQVLDDLPDQDFVTLLTYHTVEGMLCVPEYGGNRNLAGWELVRFDGDSQPLGYTIYDEAALGSYRERPDKPNAGPNPDEKCDGFSASVNEFLSAISGFAGGRAFTAPYCLEVAPT